MEEEFKKKLHHRLVSFERKYKEWEWSDVIKWLSSLKQVIEKFNLEICDEHLILISKRLSQCLNPSLPQGLHSETLKIYDIILKKSSPKHICLLSSGLFQHFQYCAPQNKLQFLNTVSENYINKPNLSVLIPGLVACLLSGASDRQETLTKVLELLDSFDNKPALHVSVWGCIMKSSKYRNVGLMYMQKRVKKEICEDLIVNTLLKALEDKNVINKRLSLDLIKNYFPITQKTEKIINLMEGALKLIKGKDFSLIRRLWEWAFPEEFNKSQIALVREIICESLANIFKETHLSILRDPQNSADYRSTSIKIIEELCESEELGEGFTKEIAISFIKHCIEDDVIKSQTTRLVLILEVHSAEIWQAISDYICELLPENEVESLNFLSFAIDYLKFTKDCSAKILKKVMSSLHKFSNFEGFLKIATKLIEKSEFTVHPKVKLRKVKKKINILIENKQEIALKEYVEIILQFTQDESEISKVLKYLKLFSEKNLILTLKAILLFEEKSLTDEDFQALWGRIDGTSEELLEILVKSYENLAESWTSGLVTLLFSENRVHYVRVFVNFWEYAAKCHQETLLQVCIGGKIVYVLIELLSDEDPTARHAAREWLNIAFKSVPCLLDPILQILLHSSTIRRVDENHNWSYINVFDTTRILDAFIKLTALLLHNRAFPSTMFNVSISNYTRKLAKEHRIDSKNYLEVLLEVSFAYIKTNNRMQEAENSIVQASATEVFRMLIIKLQEKLLEKIMLETGNLMYNIQGKNLEYSMLAVLNELFQQKTHFIYPSKIADVLVLGLRSEDHYLRHQWSKVISLALPSILTCDFKEGFCNYLSLLFINYCDIISKHNDLYIVEGLHTLIICCLNTAIIEKSKSKQIKNIIFGEMERIFMFIINFKNAPEVFKILNDVSKTFPEEVIISLIEFWHKFISHKTISISMHHIIPKLGLTPEAILDGILKSFELKKYNDNLLGSLALITIEKLYMNIKFDSIWLKTIQILKLLNDSKSEDCLAWVIKIAHLLLGLILPSGKNLVELQKILKNLLKKCQQNIIKWEKTRCNEIVKLDGNTILEVIFNEITYCQAIFRMVWRDNQKKIIRIVSNIGKHLLENMEKLEVNGVTATKLLSTLLISFPMIFETIKANLVETLKNFTFLIIYRFPESIEYWFDIINAIPKNSVFSLLDLYDSLFLKSYEVKIKLLEKSLSIISLILLSGEKDSQISNMPFIVKRIEEVIKLEKIPQELFSIVCILVRILSVRFSDFREIWLKLWPELYTGMLQYLNNPEIPASFNVLKLIDTLTVTYPEFSNVLWMYLFDVPEIELLPGHNYMEYAPAVKNYMKGFSARPTHVRRKESLICNVTRRVLLKDCTAESIEDLEKYYKILTNFTFLYTTEICEVDSNSVEESLRNEIVNIDNLLYY